MEGRDIVENKEGEHVEGAVALGVFLCALVNIPNVAIAIHFAPDWKGDFAYLFGAVFGAVFLVPLFLATIFQISKRFRGAIGFWQVAFWSSCLVLLWLSFRFLGTL